MNKNLPLSQEKKLKVIFRVEAGNLGPKGAQYVDAFCQFAQQEMGSVDAEFIHWEFTSRDNKTLPEMEFQLNNKKLSHDQAAKCLNIFDKNIDEFEEQLNDELVDTIERFMGR